MLKRQVVDTLQGMQGSKVISGFEISWDVEVTVSSKGLDFTMHIDVVEDNEGQKCAHELPWESIPTDVLDAVSALNKAFNRWKNEDGYFFLPDCLVAQPRHPNCMASVNSNSEARETCTTGS